MQPTRNYILPHDENYENDKMKEFPCGYKNEKCPPKKQSLEHLQGIATEDGNLKY